MNNIEEKEEIIEDEKEFSLGNSERVEDEALALTNADENELNTINSPLSKYTIEQKVQLIVEYILSGSLSQACERTNIAFSSAIAWRERALWWSDVVEKIRKEKQDELDGKITFVMNKGVEEVLDRIENGDEVFDKDGNKRRKKVSLRDLTTSLGILFDKRANIRGDSYGKGKSGSKEELLEEMKRKMEEFAKKIRQDERTTNVIEVVDEKDKTNT